MKSNLSKLLLTAVGMTLSATAAYGQGQLSANIPFAFQTTNASLNAGKYEIKVEGAGTRMMVRIADLASGNSILAVANYRESGISGDARLVFRCRQAGGCALVEVYDGTGSGWHFTPPRPTSAEKERLAVVLLRRADAD